MKTWAARLRRAMAATVVASITIRTAAGAGTGPIRHPDKEQYAQTSPAWSPDGRTIAYVWWTIPLGPYGGRTEATIRAFDAGSSAEIPLPGIAAQPRVVLLTHPSWSNDGTQLVMTAADHIRVIDVADPASYAPCEETGRTPAWSPDGSQIAYARDGGLRLVPASGGPVVELTDGADSNPTWSRDGMWIAFQRGDSRHSNLWRIPASGGLAVQITDGSWVDREPTWSPDGRLIAFASNRESGSMDIWVVRVATGAMSRLTNDVYGDAEPAWSPDGTRIAYVHMQGGDTSILIATDLRMVGVTRLGIGEVKARYR